MTERDWWNAWLQLWGSIGMAQLLQYCGPYIKTEVH